MNPAKTYGIDINFEALMLPLSHDVLVLAKNAAQGKHGLGRSLDLLAPGVFKAVEANLEHERIEAVFINRKLLTKISAEQLIEILQRHVFEYVAEGELIQVDMKVRISMHNIHE